MVWEKPDDLELVAECETLPELEIVRGLLESASIDSMVLTSTDSTVAFAQRSVFGRLAKKKPYKVLVRPEDAEAARGLLNAQPDALPQK